jgi:hypothetical protein
MLQVLLFACTTNITGQFACYGGCYAVYWLKMGITSMKALQVPGRPVKRASVISALHGGLGD